MNLPNKITISRIIMIPIFLISLYLATYINTPLWSYIALIIFSIASITDYIDGSIARKQGLVTSFGKFLDPLADKLLVTTAIIWFVQEGQVSALIAIIIIAREFIVTGLRILATDKGVVIAASFWGKLKTVTQMIAVLLILTRDLAPFNYIYNPISTALGIELYTILVWIAAILTLVSGADYIYKNLDVFKEKTTKKLGKAKD